MSWQTPGTDPPPEPDTETTRVDLEPPPPDTPAAPATPPSTPGLISAKPVGWTGPGDVAPDGPAGAGQPPVPVTGWTPPVTTAAPVSLTAGLVIAPTFPRFVAYTIDGLLLLAVNVSISAALGVYSGNADPALVLISSIVFVAVDLLYFVGLWLSPWQATLGMRLLRLHVVGAVSAATLSLNDAILRWLALTGAISILAIVPAIGAYVGYFALLWFLALLITTATHPLHQGLHDRWARSVVVQPAPGGSGAAVVTCLVLFVVLFFILPLGMVALYGDELRDILIEIGNSV